MRGCGVMEHPGRVTKSGVQVLIDMEHISIGKTMGLLKLQVKDIDFGEVFMLGIDEQGLHSVAFI